MKTETNLRHFTRTGSTNSVDGQIFTRLKISERFFKLSCQEFLWVTGWGYIRT